MDQSLIKASKDMLIRLHRAFEVMNWFASGDHHYLISESGKKQLRFGRTDTEAIIAEVYGVLASGFEPFKKAVEEKNQMFEISLKLDKKTKETLDRKLKKHREATEKNAEYEAGQVKTYVNLVARAAYNLGQKDVKLPVQEEDA